jgi:sporulation protein YlmC with PRC-barrel domain
MMYCKLLLATAGAWLLCGLPLQAWDQPVVRQPVAAGNVEQAEQAEQEGRVTRLRDLLGLEVISENGESYGEIEDLMLNKRTGQIEYALVAAEKDGQALYPLPWKTLTLYQGSDPKDQYVILGVERELFEKAPTVARQQWPTMTYSQWNAYVPQVTAYYKTSRPAEARAIRRAARAVRRAMD